MIVITVVHIINRWAEENEEHQEKANSQAHQSSDSTKSFNILNLLSEAGGLLYALNIIAGILASFLG